MSYDEYEQPDAKASGKSTALAKAKPEGGGEPHPLAATTKTPSGHAPGSTEGLSLLRLKQNEVEALTKSVEINEVEVRPDGILFMPAACVRQRLDDAFGPGRWALRPERDPFFDAETSECCYDGSLWIDGKFAARAMGGCRWRVGNRQMTKTDALEGAKSDCIKRCAKDLGIGRELWQPEWQRQFIAEHVEPYQGLDWKTKQPVVLWRKIGVPLSGDALANAASLAGEFPLGFGPHSKVPDGEHAGTPLREVPDEFLVSMGRSKTVEWRLAAKAEIVRRINEKKAEATSSDGGADVEAALPDDGESLEQGQQAELFGDQ